MHSNLGVAHAAFQQQGGAADHAVHQEVVLHEVEDFVGHVQGRLDANLPAVVRHALYRGKCENLQVMSDLQKHSYAFEFCHVATRNFNL